MQLTVTQAEQGAQLEIEGDIDEPGAEELRKYFEQLDLAVLKDIALDFAQVTHIGSAGIGKLLLFYKDVAAAGGRIRIVNVPPSLFHLFRELNLHTLFTIVAA
jgi:anti-anti-sigma factor